MSERRAGSFEKRPVDLVFEEAFERKQKGLCSMCERPIDLAAFDEIEYREYRISGMCHDCQVVAFTPYEEEV